MKANQLLSTSLVFLHSLKHGFGNSLYDDTEGALSKLTQTATVADFQSSVEDLMNKVEGISKPLESFCITGLKSDIHRKLLFSKPSSLMEAFALAKAYEARLDEAKLKIYQSPWWPIKTTPLIIVPRPIATSTHTSSPSSPSRPPPTSPHPTPPLLPAPFTTPSPSLPIHRFTPADVKAKRENSLCYNCDQKWSPSHRCRSRFLCLLGRDDQDEPPDEIPAPDLLSDYSSGD